MTLTISLVIHTFNLALRNRINFLGRKTMRTAKSSLTKILLVVVLSLTVAALTLTPIVDANNQVTRPFHISGQMTFYPFTDQGVATHFGSFVNNGNPFSGNYVAANGDTISWYAGGGGQCNADYSICTGTIVFNGGTGRFENATGGYDYQMILVGPGLAYTYTGGGTITY